MRLQVIIALTLALSTAAETDEVGLLQIHHGHKHKKDHDHDNSQTRLMEQRRLFDDMVMAAANAPEAERGPKVLKLVRSLVERNEQGEEFIDVQPLATLLMTSLRAAARGSNDLMDKELGMLAEEGTKAIATIHKINTDFRRELFIKESPVTGAVDITMARGTAGAANLASEMLEKAMPQYAKALQGMQLALQIAEFGSQNTAFGKTGLAGAMKFINQKIMPALKDFSVILESGLQLGKMVEAKQGGEDETALRKQASSMVVVRVRQYEKDMILAVNQLKAIYLKALADGKKDITDNPLKYSFLATGNLVAGGFGMASSAVDGAFGLWENAFKQCVQIFVDAWGVDGDAFVGERAGADLASRLTRAARW